MKKGDKVIITGTLVRIDKGDDEMPYRVNIGKKGDPYHLWFFKHCCKPLKSKVAKKPTANTGYTAAQLWKELRKRNGGRFPVKKVWVAVTEQRLNAAIKKLQHCA